MSLCHRVYDVFVVMQHRQDSAGVNWFSRWCSNSH